MKGRNSQMRRGGLRGAPASGIGSADEVSVGMNPASTAGADKGAVRWVFGYGSLMWRPEFPYVEREAATLHGRRRAFYIYSVHHRGTHARPGLVLGLAPGGAVRGVAYRVADT